jgi:hypothetical protein
MGAGNTWNNPEGPQTYWWAFGNVTVWPTEAQADDDLRSSSQSGTQQTLLGATCNVSDVPGKGEQLWQCRAHNVAVRVVGNAGQGNGSSYNYAKLGAGQIIQKVNEQAR